jgi:hypothetical protein
VWSIAIAVPSDVFRADHPEFVALGRVSAALYKPDTGRRRTSAS